LRGVLRQDPDVVLVGEIRDGETANIATEAALTGHLVLSSLHTNDSIQAITRLLELGVEAHMVAPTIVGILSQRLVRRVCSACKESYTASTAELEPFFENPGSSPVTLYRGKGCTRCFGTGYSGRTGVHEYLEVSEEMRDLIISTRRHPCWSLKPKTPATNPCATTRSRRPSWVGRHSMRWKKIPCPKRSTARSCPPVAAPV
jgi:type II secretory ATPase GspE/PulE/Tfp pilus assembly ATPase PilB-like protein